MVDHDFMEGHFAVAVCVLPPKQTWDGESLCIWPFWILSWAAAGLSHCQRAPKTHHSLL